MLLIYYSMKIIIKVISKFYKLANSSQKYISENNITKSFSIINFLTNLPKTKLNMISKTEKQSNELKRNQRSVQSRSNSSRSEKYCSASKSLKAFEGSLRKQDSNSGKDDGFNSPLKKRINFGKIDQPQSKSKEKTYIVDTLKKIKKVESPFQEKPRIQVFQDKIQASETNLLISCFDSISEKVEGESSIQQQKIKSTLRKIESDIENIHGQEEMIQCEEELFKVQPQEPFQIAIFSESLESLMEVEVPNEGDQKIEIQAISEPKQESSEGIQSDQVMQSSSVISSLKSKSSETIRLKKKEMKIKKRKEKKTQAKKMKIKLRNITNFVDELHQKKTHTDRKELVSQLSEHLWERKFTRLRKELKRLI